MKTTSFVALAAFASRALSALPPPALNMGLITHKALSLDMALAMAHGSLDKCRSLNYKCAVTVLDATGRTIIALQDDGAALRTRFDISRKKRLHRSGLPRFFRGE